ncbi:MAG: metal ABC transporter ATP-binding protein, partial [Nitrosopumilaceae archaeon]
MKVVEINDLTVQYPGVKALDNVSFSINEGDFLGIIGPNGAGKSTLFSCMLGILTNYKGTIKFFGEDISKSKNYLKQIGYVPQKPVFDTNFPATVKDVVSMAWTNHSDKETIDQVLQQVWMHELGDRRIGELSGGQQQRVFIA